MVDIKGFVDSSFIEWEGKITTVLYLPGCNLRCPWCYTIDLVENPDKIPTIPWSKIRDHLINSKTWVDGVVITGGEPTIHKDLPELFAKIKAIGYRIKLDTNGTNPSMLQQLIDEKLVDFISLDIKNQPDPEKYSRAIGLEATEFLKDIKRSISILLTAGVPYEFRTTVVPNIHEIKDVQNITRHTGVCKGYVIQPYKSAETINPKCSNMKPFDKFKLGSFLRTAQRIIPHARVR